jgi:hypothetical protein
MERWDEDGDLTIEQNRIRQRGSPNDGTGLPGKRAPCPTKSCGDLARFVGMIVQRNFARQPIKISQNFASKSRRYLLVISSNTGWWFGT